MRSQIGHTDVSDQDLQLYFDGELTGADAQELAAQIDAEPELKAEFQSLGLLREIVSASALGRAAEVPAARFEQIWDEIDRAIEQDARAKQADGARDGSIWSRIAAVWRPARWPLAAAAAAAAVVFVAMRPGDGPPNKPDEVASVEQPVQPPDTPMPSSLPPTDAIAQAPSESAPAFEQPTAQPAEIFDVEFGGKNGRISQTGTVTVLYVEEDATPEDSERSL